MDQPTLAPIQSAAMFLSGWISDEVLAQCRGIAEIDQSVRDVIGAAVTMGFTADSLHLAAGGDLRGHIKAAIELWSGDAEA